MQQKLQTILFFTFLICVQISYTNTLKIKSKLMSNLKQNATITAAQPSSNNHHKKLHHESNLNKAQNIGQSNVNLDQHRNQFHIHHVVPMNLTSINNKVRNRFDEAHEKLDEIVDLKKEALEDKLFHFLPHRPNGITGAAIINLRNGEIDEKSDGFQVSSIKDFVDAIDAADEQKSRRVKVDGQSYKLVKVSRHFYYGAIVGNGGIGVYQKYGYLIVVTHNNNMQVSEFAFVFGQIIDGLRHHKPIEKFRFFKDNFDEKKQELHSRLKNDNAIYQQERNN